LIRRGVQYHQGQNPALLTQHQAALLHLGQEIVLGRIGLSLAHGVGKKRSQFRLG
jgi:hypothetical protein